MLPSSLRLRARSLRPLRKTPEACAPARTAHLPGGLGLVPVGDQRPPGDAHHQRRAGQRARLPAGSRERRLAVEHVLGMLAAGDTPETILSGYPWLEPEDIQACLVYALRLVGHERVEPLLMEPAA